MVHKGWLLKYILGKDCLMFCLQTKNQLNSHVHDKPYLYSLIAKVGHTVVGVLKLVIPFLSINKNTLLLASRVIPLAFI